MRLASARFYLRFLGSAYAGVPALRARARRRAPQWLARFVDTCGVAGRRLAMRSLDVLEPAVQAPERYRSFLIQHQPDVVVLTPLVVLKTAQLDLARAAVQLGIRNVFAVASWDHLSSKGELDFPPQRVLVWNEVQKREASALHGLDPATVRVTGSQVFDEWFTRQPSTTREDFCARVGLRADSPIVLYVCSSLLEGSTAEPPFVLRWARHLRDSGYPVLRECGILVRPHHERGWAWRKVDTRGLDNFACWPPLGDSPVDAQSKSDYFDSLYHADVVVGLNTSAMIEAAIVGRPVCTVLLPEFRDDQEGTLHFHYLLDGADALLHSARSLEDHAQQLARLLESGDPDPERSRTFVRTFVRPLGPDTPATTTVVEAIETLVAQPPPAPVPPAAWRLVVKPLLRPVLLPFAYGALRRVKRLKEESRLREERRLSEHRRRKRELRDEKRARQVDV